MAQGDLISVQCRRGLFTYLHYGIEIGDGTVVHLATEANGCDMSVQRVSMEEFSNGATVCVETVEPSLPDSTVVASALGAVGRKGYHLVIGNCEHFARLIKTGNGKSVQVDMYVNTVFRTAFSGFASAARRHVIAKSITLISQSKFLIAVGSLVPTVVGETARQGAYLTARKLKMTHEEAERSSRSVAHAASAIGGFVVGGPVGSAGALAIAMAADRVTDAIERRFPSQN